MHMGVTKEKQNEFTKENLEDAIRNRVATRSAFGNDAEEAFEELKAFYVDRGTEEEKKDPRFYFNRYTALISDIQFVLPVIRDALIKSRLDWNVYVYLFDWVNPQLGKDNGFYAGANHGLELAYLHGTMLFTPFEFTKTDEEVKETYAEGVANFFKYGNPSGKEHTWPKMSKGHDFHYLHLAEHSQIAWDFFKERLDFWEKFDEKHDFHVVRGEFKISKKTKDEL